MSLKRYSKSDIAKYIRAQATINRNSGGYTISSATRVDAADAVKKVKEQPVKKLRKPVLWTSADGLYVVVEGPFPEGFTRCLTGRTVRAASERSVYGDEGLLARPATNEPGKYAKTLRELIDDGYNEFGEVAP